MKKILIIQGGGRANGNTAQLVNSFAKGAKNAGHEVEILSLQKNEVKGCALLMTAADNFFWTFEQAVSYYKFTLVNYIGFHDKGMVLAGGCGDTNGKVQIDKTEYLEKGYELGKKLYL